MAQALVQRRQHVHAQRDEDVGADAKAHMVRRVVVRRIDRRRAAQAHQHLGAGDRQALAGADVERHALPAPGVDEQAHGGEGLGGRVLGHAGLVQVADELAAHDVVLAQRAHRLQHLDLLVADRFAVGARRRLHRQVAQQLEQVVLHHVADRAGVVVEGAAALHAEVLGHGDLHAFHVVAVPEGLEQARCAKRKCSMLCTGPLPR